MFPSKKVVNSGLRLTLSMMVIILLLITLLTTTYDHSTAQSLSWTLYNQAA